MKPKGSLDHKLYRLHPGLRMTSRIKHLQFAILYPFTRVTNTKSMTPNQLRLRASGFKGYRHIPLRPCSASRQSFTTFIFLFLLFFFFFFLLFLFFSFLEDYIGLQMWEILTYPRLPTNLRPDLQSERGEYNFTVYWYNLVCSV